MEIKQAFTHNLLKLIKIFSCIFKIENPLNKNKYKLSFNNDTMDFEYSPQWYDISYHLGRIGIDKKEFSEIREQYEAAGYRDRFESVFSKVDVPATPINWLEVGCHLGLTSYWIGTKYPKSQLYMLDFSEQSIQFCKRKFPYKDRAVIWQASVEDIRLDGSDFSKFFDFMTCLDVTEHLPDQVYQKMLKELFRVCKIGGHLVVMQGNGPSVEHIHVLPEKQLVSDFLKSGFVLEKRLPARHYLFLKP